MLCSIRFSLIFASLIATSACAGVPDLSEGAEQHSLLVDVARNGEHTIVSAASAAHQGVELAELATLVGFAETPRFGCAVIQAGRAPGAGYFVDLLDERAHLVTENGQATLQPQLFPPVGAVSGLIYETELSYAVTERAELTTSLGSFSLRMPTHVEGLRVDGELIAARTPSPTRTQSQARVVGEHTLEWNSAIESNRASAPTTLVVMVFGDGRVRWRCSSVDAGIMTIDGSAALAYEHADFLEASRVSVRTTTPVGHTVRLVTRSSERFEFLASEQGQRSSI